jgi:hypothetical protein
MRIYTWNTVGSAHMALLDKDIQAESSCKSPSDKSWIKIRAMKQECKEAIETCGDGTEMSAQGS